MIGTKSKLIIRNNTASQGNAAYAFYNTGGSPLYSSLDVPIGGNSVVITTSPLLNYAGLADVAVQQDGSILVEAQKGIISADSYNGIAAVDGSNPGWGQVNTNLHAPVIMNNYYGWYTDLVLFNSGSTTANVTVYYYREGIGYENISQGFTIAPNGSYTPGRIGDADKLYSAYIVSDRPLAGVVRQFSGNIFCTYNALAAVSGTAYGPVIMNDYYGWDTSVNVQNTGDFQATVSVYYYNADGSHVGDQNPEHVDTIKAHTTKSYYSPAEGFLPAGFLGTVRVVSAQNVVLVINQSGPHGQTLLYGMAYDGAPATTTANAIVPDVRNYYDPGNWVTSINVMNLGGSATTATVTYNGQSYNSPSPINPYGMYSFYMPTYLGLASSRGSAIVSASGGQKIAVVVNQSSSNPLTADLAISYDAWNR